MIDGTRMTQNQQKVTSSMEMGNDNHYLGPGFFVYTGIIGHQHIYCCCNEVSDWPQEPLYFLEGLFEMCTKE